MVFTCCINASAYYPYERMTIYPSVCAFVRLSVKRADCDKTKERSGHIFISIIVTEWCKLSQRFIDCAIGQWRRRLECVVQQQNGHIEHLI